MKFYQNTSAFILLILVLALPAIGCKGGRSSSIGGNSLTGGSLTKSGQSSDVIAKENSRRAEIDFGTDSDVTTGRSSNVALASYTSRDKNEGEVQWLKSYDDAMQISKQTGRPILAGFTGSNWCPPCIKLKKEVFETASFKNWAAENVVLLELDFPRPNLQPEWIKKQNNELKNRYSRKIKGYPTVLILNSQGDVLGTQGYIRGGPDRWISGVNNTIQANQASLKSEVVGVADYNVR